HQKRCGAAGHIQSSHRRCHQEQSESQAKSQGVSSIGRLQKAAGHLFIFKPSTVRDGESLFESEHFFAVLKHLPDDIKPVAVTAYVTGWGVPDEILTRQKHHLDFKNGWLRLGPGGKKKNKGRKILLTPHLLETPYRAVPTTPT